MPAPGMAGRSCAGRAWQPLELEAKEGLALLNGTQLMGALAALAAHDARRLAASADAIGAMSLEAMLGTAAAFDEELIAARPHPGQVAVAAHLRALLAGSQIGASHADSPHRVQDAYSSALHAAGPRRGSRRARPARAGPGGRDERRHRQPARLPRDGRIVSGGNFHGEPAGARHRLREGRGRGAGLDLRAAHRPPGRRAPLRAAGLPLRVARASRAA